MKWKFSAWGESTRNSPYWIFSRFSLTELACLLFWRCYKRIRFISSTLHFQILKLRVNLLSATQPNMFKFYLVLLPVEWFFLLILVFLCCAPDSWMSRENVLCFAHLLLKYVLHIADDLWTTAKLLEVLLKNYFSGVCN